MSAPHVDPVNASASHDDDSFASLSPLLSILSKFISLLMGIHSPREFWDVFGPGGKLHPQYFLEHKGHLVIEALLLFAIAYLFLQQAFKPRPKAEEPLTEREIDALCREWKPEPLVPQVADSEMPKERVVSGMHGVYATVDGKRVLNLASANFLQLGGTPEMLEIASKTVAKYGVGSCGPRGFYGTIDVHLQLEKHLAAFFECPQATMFAYDIATVASVIPACANRKDIIVADECCSYPIQQGLTLSRAAVHFFKHNDVADLERVLQEVEAREQAEHKPLCRKLIVTEGVFANVGDIPPLDKIFAIKEKYKYRLVVEETFAFGVLGARGRGACEQFGLKAGQVEVICASLSGALGSIGGFCVGDPDVVEHQRLAGSGYVFSASLPPFLTTAADSALTQLQRQGSSLRTKLHQNTASLRAQLKKIPGLHVSSGPNWDPSPVIHIRLASSATSTASLPPQQQQEAASQLLRRMADIVFDRFGVFLSCPAYSALERLPPQPSLRLFVSAGLTDKEVSAAVAAVRGAAKEVLGQTTAH